MKLNLRWGSVDFDEEKNTISGISIDGMNFTVKNVSKQAIQKWQNGSMIQNCFPFMNIDDRELLISGLSSKAFDDMFKE